MIVIGLFALSVSMECFTFDEGNVEIWYQIPVNSINAPAVDSAAPESTLQPYRYHITITEIQKRDSVVVDGTTQPRPFEGPAQRQSLYGYLPVRLYPGHFICAAEIMIAADTSRFKREITIDPDTLPLTASDLMAGFRAVREGYAYHDMPFFPSLAAEFTVFDTVFLFLEIYGLIPDSARYEATYQILDPAGHVVFQKKVQRIKYAFTQPDTMTIGLADLEPGPYDLCVTIRDPAQAGPVSRCRPMQVKKTVIDITRMKYYAQIQYLVSSGELKKFRRLSASDQKEYLTRYWSVHDYWVFHKRIEEADMKFTLSRLPGRDSERGRYYIKNGPPEEIEPIHFLNWANYMEIWHYIGYDVLFCDTKGDYNPVLIRTFRPGELLEKLELGFTEEDLREWLPEVAPGAWDKGKRPDD